MSSKRSINIGDEVMLRVRATEKDVHYAGGLVNGAWVLGLFGDLGTALLIRYDGDEGMSRAYSNVDLLAPIHAGNYIEAVGKIVKVGNTSRTIELEARNVISSANIADQPSAAEVLDKPVLVAKATLTCVVPKHLQRYND